MSGTILMDASNAFGLDRVDAEVVQWIEAGYFDEYVLERADKIRETTDVPAPVAYFQRFHKDFHKEEPVGWEYCNRCATLLKRYA